jgi:hypothetical protein
VTFVFFNSYCISVRGFFCLHLSQRWESSSNITGHDSSSSQPELVLLLSSLLTQISHGLHSGASSTRKPSSICSHRISDSIYGINDSIFNVLVAPVPIIQVFNLLAGLFILSIEWPLPFLRHTPLYKAFVHRFVLYPVVAGVALLQYQATNAAFYLLIGTAYVM